jgi:hypothetical protein
MFDFEYLLNYTFCVICKLNNDLSWSEIFRFRRFKSYNDLQTKSYIILIKYLIGNSDSDTLIFSQLRALKLFFFLLLCF